MCDTIYGVYGTIHNSANMCNYNNLYLTRVILSYIILISIQIYIYIYIYIILLLVFIIIDN